jgi:O-antigen ligase
VRFAFRGHGRALLAVVVVAGAALTLMSLLHFGDRVNSRLDNSSSNTGRVTTYDATYHEVLRSPVLGFGAPSSSTVSVNGPDLGTQGQFWTVLYSSGFVGAALFVLAFLNLVWKTRKARTSSQMWLHVVGVIALAVLLVYRIQATELVLFMVAMAVVLRDSPAPLRVGGRPVAAVRRGQRR